MWLKIVLFFWLIRTYLFCKCNESGSNFFGGSGPFEEVDEVEGYPKMLEFFQMYVENNRPLKMVGAAKRSPAFSLWSDSYLMSKSGMEEEYVSVEENKKEDRKQAILNMAFPDFLRMYNDSNHYLVNNLPPPLLKDIFLPSPLQCPQIYKHLLLENIMWMSSGNTHSVVHTDNIENIICVFRGSKRFVMVDPVKYSGHVHMDHPDEGYSDIDVDQVDYSKYSGLLSVKYQEVSLTSGDCLYIPYEWIHQVTSMGSNIAVNVWWHHTNTALNLTTCPHHPYTTLADGVFRGHDAKIGLEFRSDFSGLLQGQARDLTLEQFCAVFLVEGEEMKDFSEAEFTYLKEMFVACDANEDGTVEQTEVEGLSESDWESIEVSYKLFDEEGLKRGDKEGLKRGDKEGLKRDDNGHNTHSSKQEL